MRILLTANTSWYLVNFRTSLIEALRERGHTIATAAPVDEWSRALDRFGAFYRLEHLRATGRNPLLDLRLHGEYRRIFAGFAPDLVLSFTAKSNIYASFAAHGFAIRVIPTINGLGRGLVSAGPISFVVSRLYTAALRGCPRVFVQNHDDRDFLVSNGILSKDRVSVTPGSGIDLESFAPAGSSHADAAESGGTLRALYIGRILPEKGVGELIEAVSRLRAEALDIELLIAGRPPDDVQAPLRDRDLRQAHDRGEIVYHGMVSDVRPLIAECDVVVLPSYYPEGVPRALIEALAMATPIITTDQPGCRETVNGENGFLVAPQSAGALADALRRFASLTPEQRRKMGSCGRRLAVERFDERVVIEMYLAELDRSPQAVPARRSSETRDDAVTGGVALSNRYRVFKRTIDLALSTLAIAVLSPVLAGIAVVLKLTGEHAVIYRQRRVGEDFELFNVFKFVTMRTDSERYGTITAKGDPRVLPVGRLLRKSKANELPQLFNVVLGRMSVVGPRPLVDTEVRTYPEHIRDVIYDDNRPGLTGMGSLFFRDEEEIIAATGKKPSVAYREDIMPVKGELELWYRRRRSARLDLKIILLTLWAIVSPTTAPILRSFSRERDFPRTALDDYRRLCALLHAPLSNHRDEPVASESTQESASSA